VRANFIIRRVLTARLASEQLLKNSATIIMFQLQRRSIVGDPTISPVRKGDHRWGEIGTTFGEDVLVLSGILTVLTQGHQAGCNHSLQPQENDLARCADTGLEFRNASKPTEEGFLDDQRTPRLTDGSHRICY